MAGPPQCSLIFFGERRITFTDGTIFCRSFHLQEIHPHKVQDKTYTKTRPPEVSRTVTPCIYEYVHKWVKIQESGSFKNFVSVHQQTLLHIPRGRNFNIHTPLPWTCRQQVRLKRRYHINGAIPSSELSHTPCYVSITYHRNIVVGRAPQLLRIPMVSGLNLDPQIHYPEWHE